MSSVHGNLGIRYSQPLVHQIKSQSIKSVIPFAKLGMTVFGYVFLFAALLLPRAAAEVRCRFNTTAPTPVTYYTCTELALKYGITIEHFFMLNPLLDPDCSSIQSGNRYCVAGNVVPVSTDGSCKPEDYFTCLGYSGGQCCNSETWKCGQTKYVERSAGLSRP